ncbi:MAG: hypothetical protein KDC54_03215, partial [Lewinella sp.]|nr:hypothetical protein [Lewinella sp.]
GAGDSEDPNQSLPDRFHAAKIAGAFLSPGFCDFFLLPGFFPLPFGQPHFLWQAPGAQQFFQATSRAGKQLALFRAKQNNIP